jgi:hypothetical protein
LRRVSAISLFLVFTVSYAFAHAGEVHTYMGTVTKLNGASGFTLKTADGKQITVQTSKSTTYWHANNQAAKWSEIVTGSRVVVKMSKDGKTAASVKMSPAKKK